MTTLSNRSPSHNTKFENSVNLKARLQSQRKITFLKERLQISEKDYTSQRKISNLKERLKNLKERVKISEKDYKSQSKITNPKVRLQIPK